MRKIFLGITMCCFALLLSAQDIGVSDIKKINGSNTWFKLGINLGIPVGDLGDASNFAPGVELSVQYLKTKAYGYGLKVGYTHYLAKNANVEDFSAIPIAALFRFYPESTGFFGGLELGYAFINNVPGTNGGIIGRPQVGYHTNNWNFFGYYDYISTEEDIIDFTTMGLGVTYNLRWK